jgi:hypothetical protein
MNLEATVQYGNGRACFKIHKENPGIYYASLMYFEGSQHSSPPQEIMLVRGVRQWAGSHEDKTLLNELVKFIEEAYRKSSVN